RLDSAASLSRSPLRAPYQAEQAVARGVGQSLPARIATNPVPFFDLRPDISMTHPEDPVYAFGEADGISSILVKQRMNVVAHLRPIDGADHDGMCSMAVAVLQGTEHTRLCVDNEGDAAVVQLPVSVCEPIFNALAAERSRQLVLVS